VDWHCPRSEGQNHVDNMSSSAFSDLETPPSVVGPCTHTLQYDKSAPAVLCCCLVLCCWRPPPWVGFSETGLSLAANSVDVIPSEELSGCYVRGGSVCQPSCHWVYQSGGETGDSLSSCGVRIICAILPVPTLESFGTRIPESNIFEQVSRYKHSPSTREDDWDLPYFWTTYEFTRDRWRLWVHDFGHGDRFANGWMPDDEGCPMGFIKLC